VAPPVFKTGLAGIAFAGGFDSLPPPSAAPLRSGTQCGAPLVRLDPTRSLTYGVNRQLRKMREEVQFLRNLYEASSGFELHPPWTAYLSVKLLRNRKAVSGIPTVSIDSRNSSGVIDGAHSRLRILATAASASSSSKRQKGSRRMCQNAPR